MTTRENRAKKRKPSAPAKNSSKRRKVRGSEGLETFDGTKSEDCCLSRDPHLKFHFHAKNSSTDYWVFLDRLLHLGEELNLYKWMLHFNLLRKPEKCLQPTCRSSTIILKESALNQDRYSWLCKGCNHRISIRINSLFSNVRCSIQQTLLLIMAWCNKMPLQECKFARSISPSDINQIHKVCFDAVSHHMKLLAEVERMGGHNSVVLLDVWPNDSSPVPCPKKATKLRWCERLQIAWLADTKHVPVRYWARVLPPMKSSSELRSQARTREMMYGKSIQVGAQHFKTHAHFSDSENDPCQENILNLCKKQVMPVPAPRFKLERRKAPKGYQNQKRLDEEERVRETVKAVVEVALKHIAVSSLVVVNEKALPGVREALLASRKFDGVISIDQLLNFHNGGGRPTSNILRNIWHTATDMCQELQMLKRLSAQPKLTEFLWRQRFPKEDSKSLYHMLCQLAMFGSPDTKSEL